MIGLWDCWRWCQLVLSIRTNLIKTHQQPILYKPKRFGNTSSNTVARIAPCRFLGDALCTALITMTGESMDLCDRGYLIYDALKPLSDNHCCVPMHINWHWFTARYECTVGIACNLTHGSRSNPVKPETYFLLCRRTFDAGSDSILTFLHR